MKRIKYLLFTIICLPLMVHAATNATISAPSTVDNGSSVKATVTVTDTAAWNLSIKGSGATSGCSTKVADVTANGQNTKKSFTLSCKATSLGTITFEVTGDITSSSGSTKNISLSKSVTVVAPREKETISELKSLSVTGYDIGFSPDKKEYQLEIEPTVTQITISATKSGTYETITGTGTFEVPETGKTFVITGVAENGTKTEYKINVTVVEKNPIKITIDGVEYTVIKNASILKAPSNTTSTTVKIQDNDIPAYKNEKANITVIGIKDSNNNIKYAIYENDTYKLYNENTSSALLLYISEKKLDNYEETTIEINNNQYKAYKINDRFVLVYAMNIADGTYNYYKYDTIDKTFQLYEQEQNEVIENTTTTKKKFNWLILIVVILILGLIGVGIFFIIKKKKNKKETSVTEPASVVPITTIEPETTPVTTIVQPEPIPVTQTIQPEPVPVTQAFPTVTNEVTPTTDPNSIQM